MKEIAWILGLGIVGSLFAWIALPREEMGDVDFAAVAKCFVSVEVEPYSAPTYFKSFTCTSAYSQGLNCYHLEFQDGLCVKSIQYYKPPRES